MIVCSCRSEDRSADLRRLVTNFPEKRLPTRLEDASSFKSSLIVRFA